VFTIRRDDPGGTEVRALVEEHLPNLYEITPPESVHAFDIGKLRQPDVTFWSVWADDALVGCGALRELDRRHGEIKSMRTVAARRRSGVGRAVLQHIIGEARRRGYERLSLETGSMKEFEAARNLYAGFGFSVCAPFGEYRDDPNSVFMTRILHAGA